MTFSFHGSPSGSLNAAAIKSCLCRLSFPPPPTTVAGFNCRFIAVRRDSNRASRRFKESSIPVAELADPNGFLLSLGAFLCGAPSSFSSVDLALHHRGLFLDG